MADFFAETEKLAKKIGDGTISSVFGVDGGDRTIPLELGGWKTGPNAGAQITNWTTKGTGPHAAQKSLGETYEISLEYVSKTALTEGPRRGMERAVERINDRFQEIAPKDTGQYRESTRRVVLDNGRKVYDVQGPSYGEEPNG